MTDGSQAGSGPSETGEVVVILRLQFRPGTAEQVRRRMAPGIRLTREEPGNNDFQFFQVNGEEDSFFVYERWKDKAALDWHWQQSYTKDALQLFQELLVRPLSETRDVSYLTDVMSIDPEGTEGTV